MTKIFHELPDKEQDDIRRMYKDKWTRDYKYSIRLYILYVILGIISTIGMIFIYFDFMFGLIIFTVSFILMAIVVYFLYLSNKSFIRFLKTIDMEYDIEKK